MKNQKTKIILLSAATLAAGVAAQAQSNVYSTPIVTYQGRLSSGASVASGSYDLLFSLYATNSGGSPIAGPLTNPTVAVNGGLFTVDLNFGGGAFSGGDRWMEIGVRSNSFAPFTTLSPRQAITPAPYAI